MSPAEIAAHTDLIRMAIADPGQFCERNRTWDDGWEEWDYERITSWSARAVVIALAGAEEADRDCHAPVKDAELHDTFPVGRQVRL